MSRLVITTENSTYHVDTERRTWSRELRSTASGLLRSESGEFLEMLMKDHLTLVCPPINDHSQFRLISTSPILSVKEIQCSQKLLPSPSKRSQQYLLAASSS